MTISLEALAGALIMMLLGGNLFFIKRLIDKVEIAADSAKTASSTSSAVGNQLREVKADIKELRRIELDVVALKTLYFGHRAKKKPPADEEGQPHDPENGAG